MKGPFRAFTVACVVWCLACDAPPPPAGSDGSTVDLFGLLPAAELSTQLDEVLNAALAEPHDFTPTGGSWSHDADEIRDTSSPSGESEVSSLVRLTPEIADATISAQVRLSSEARMPSGGGILFRMRNARNGFGLVLDEGGGIRLVAIREGRAQTLAANDAIVEKGRWYTLGVSMAANRFAAFLDGRPVLESALGDAPPTGGIGLVRARGEGAAFRRLSIGSGQRTAPVSVSFAEVPLSIAPLLNSSGGHRGAPPSRPWELLVQTIDLNGDFRKSLMVPPDSEIRVPVTLPRQPVLHLEIGVLPSSLVEPGGSSRLRIGFEDASRRRTWLAMHHVSTQAHWRSWEPATLDLGNLDGAQGCIVLRNESIGPGGSFVALASPVVRSGAETRAPGRANLILVTVDTLRADHLGAYGYTRDTSPFMDSLAARSVVFEEVTAQSSWTKTSMASMLTSTYPELNGVRGADHLLPTDLPTLAGVLEQQGYFTAGVQTNPWLLPRFQFSRGFAEYQWLQAAPPAARVNERAVEILNRRGEAPFFLYLHYMDVHHPYTPSGAYRRFGTLPADAYDGEIRSLDDQLAGLYQSLAEKGLLDNTLFVIASDHGEEFGEHGGSFHGGTLYYEQLRVPLILDWKGRLPAGRRVAGPIRNLDVAPTLLDLLDVAVPPRFQGVSWKQRILSPGTAASGDVAVFSQTGLNDVAPDSDLISVEVGNWKFIKDRRSTWNRLFDRSVDAAEQRDLSTSRTEIRADLERRCDEFLASNEQGRSANDTATVDPAVAEQLRSLGYLMNAPAAPSKGEAGQADLR
ncbi:MAG: sulfatase-like hydrolase/transferase [Deltaproteobacteria bacterium]|nr:sulfatase-like hydrolase/transferase [Deltaproteobacteria bacterium]